MSNLIFQPWFFKNQVQIDKSIGINCDSLNSNEGHLLWDDLKTLHARKFRQVVCKVPKKASSCKECAAQLIFGCKSYSGIREVYQPNILVLLLFKKKNWWSYLPAASIAVNVKTTNKTVLMRTKNTIGLFTWSQQWYSPP